MPQPNAVIFDLDGVLVDSYDAHFRSWTRMLAEVGVEFDEQQFRGTFGRTNKDIFHELFQGEISQARAAALGERKEVLYRNVIREEFPPMPGAVELIDRLGKAGFLLAVGSSGPPENVELSLQLLQRRDAFQSIVTGADVHRGKPDPQVFLLAAEGLGVDPSRCLVIEDAPQGIEAARRAGMSCVALTGTSTRAELEPANLVVDLLTELQPVQLAELLGA